LAVQLVHDVQTLVPSKRPPEMYSYRTSNGAAATVGSSLVLRPKMRRFLPRAVRMFAPRQLLHAEASTEPAAASIPPPPHACWQAPGAPDDPLAPELPPELPPELEPELPPEPLPELPEPELAPELPELDAEASP
jgi:hypothetical protein